MAELGVGVLRGVTVRCRAVYSPPGGAEGGAQASRPGAALRGGWQQSSRRPAPPLARLAPGPTRDESHAGALRVVRIRGDGRCMFRALALGLANNKGVNMSASQEEAEADLLRMAVADAICRTPSRRADFGEAVMSIKTEDKLERYCHRIQSPSFWGGEPELLVLSKLLKTPIRVYLPDERVGFGYTPLVTYGEKFSKTKSGKDKKVVRLLYNGKNHYDLLL